MTRMEALVEKSGLSSDFLRLSGELNKVKKFLTMMMAICVVSTYFGTLQTRLQFASERALILHGHGQPRVTVV